MPALWTGNSTTGVANLGFGLGVLRGQLLAIGVAAAVVAVLLVLRPILGHSAYLLMAPALLACAFVGGPAAALTATVAMAAGGVTLDALSDIPLLERGVRLGAFLVLGVGAWAGALVLTFFVLIVSLLARALVLRNRIAND